MVLQETVQRQEAELNMHRAAIGSLREERDKLRQRVRLPRGETFFFDYLIFLEIT